MQNLRAIAVSPVVQEFRTLTQRKHKRYIHKCHHRKANEKKNDQSQMTKGPIESIPCHKSGSKYKPKMLKTPTRCLRITE